MKIDELYGLPLDRFVPERTALSRRLRADGRREEATEVAARSKPSVAAWAINQLVRTQQKELTALLKAGDALRQAQDGVLGGQGDGRALRAAAEAERTAVDALVGRARGLLTSEGHQLSASILERVAETLHAAALDDQARALVRPGCLERELRHVGFGAGLGATSPPQPARAAPKRRPPAGQGGAQRAPEPDAKRDRAEREQAERERATARKAARATASEARRRAERAERALRHAEEQHDRAAQSLADADAALAEARAEAEAAAAAQAQAEKDLERLSG